MVKEVGGTPKSGIKELMEHQQKTKYKISTNVIERLKYVGDQEIINGFRDTRLSPSDLSME